MQRTVAVALTAGALLWAAVLFLAPLALSSRSPRLAAIAASVYGGCGLICHQRPERSFRLAGVQVPVCARCTGLYVSGAVGALAAWTGRRRARVPRHGRATLLVLSIPTIVTVAAEWLGLAHPSSLARAVAAVPLGAAAAWLIVRMLQAEGDGHALARTRDACGRSPSA